MTSDPQPTPPEQGPADSVPEDPAHRDAARQDANHQDAKPPADPAYKDRVHRSPAAIAGGVLLLAIGVWLGVDALIRGEGNTPWIALAGLLFAVPLVVAYTVRPAVFSNEDRLRVRNPFRTIVLPWGAISGLRSGYSNEVFTQDGTKFQLWAIPVSLRGRKKAARRHAQQVASDDPVASRVRPGAPGATPPNTRDAGDQAMDDLREIAERREHAEAAQGEPVVRWAYEILGPCAAGAVLLAVLIAVG
ncbi:PH domain-containing protein [Streptomyces silvensis]|uniref:PH domain-containing protein n=1 Tax=Streptomyces silvensis TaxID=1765722 RepID=UPI00099EB20A|nr:PH domain-containing protein [Streptomyces silvensis]